MHKINFWTLHWMLFSMQLQWMIEQRLGVFFIGKINEILILSGIFERFPKFNENGAIPLNVKLKPPIGWGKSAAASKIASRKFPDDHYFWWDSEEHIQWTGYYEDTGAELWMAVKWWIWHR